MSFQYSIEMIDYFVKIFPGEAPYSYLMRLKENLCFSDQEFCKYVLNKNRITAKIIYGIVDFQHLKKTFSKFIEETEVEWIEKHTLLNYLINFIPRNNIDVFDTFHLGRSHLERFFSIEKDPVIKFCPQCIQEDFLKYDNYIIKKHHQLIGNYICIRHNIPLFYRDINKNNRTIQCIKIKELLNLENSQQYEINDFNNFQLLSQTVNKLFYKPEPLKDFKSQYIPQAYQSNNWNIAYDDLIFHLNLYYGDFIKEIEKLHYGRPLDIVMLKSIFHLRYKSIDPILLLLLLNFNLNIPESIKGREPENSGIIVANKIECINTTCEYHGRVNPTLVELKKGHHNNYTAYYKCDNCAIVFTKSYFSTHHSEKMRIIEYGNLFLNELEKLLQKETLPHLIRQQLEIHESTILRLAVLNDFNYKYIEDRIIKNKKVLKNIALFDDLLDSSLRITKELIFKKFKKEYKYLRMYYYPYYHFTLRNIPNDTP